MLKDSQPPRYAVRRTHRTYTPQFKAELVAACMQPGASIAALALRHGMNANVLHRWCKEFHQGHHRQSLVGCRRQSVSVTVHWPVSAAAQCAQMLQELLR